MSSGASAAGSVTGSAGVRSDASGGGSDGQRATGSHLSMALGEFGWPDEEHWDSSWLERHLNGGDEPEDLFENGDLEHALFDW